MGGKGDEDAETMATILHHLCLIKSKIYEDMKTGRVMIMVYVWDNPFISVVPKEFILYLLNITFSISL